MNNIDKKIIDKFQGLRESIRGQNHDTFIHFGEKSDRHGVTIWEFINFVDSKGWEYINSPDFDLQAELPW